MNKRLVASLMGMAMLASLLSGCSSSSGGNASSAQENAYKPTSALTLVVCASAGGDSDINARLFAEKMAKVAGVPVVVSNISGGSGSIGFQAALDAGTDGNTALFYQTSLTAAASAGSCPNYVSEKFDIISCMIQDKTNGWYVSSESPYQNITDIVEAAKAAPDTITYATEVGANTYAMLLMFEDAAGVSLHAVDVGTTAEKNAALLAGTVDILPAQWGVVKEYVEAGQYRCLGFTSKERPAVKSDVPTFIEQGVEASQDRYFMMAFPKGTDPAIESYWSNLMDEICADENYRQEFFEASGTDIIENPSAAVEKWLDQEDYFRSLEDMMRGKG